MSSIKIKLSEEEIKKLQTTNNDNYIISALKKAYPGLNLSFFDQAGKLSFNSMNLGNINNALEFLTQKINQYLFSAKDKIVWGEMLDYGTCIGYAHENMNYVITEDEHGKFGVEQSIRQLDSTGHLIKEISVEAIEKFRLGTKYEPTRYASLAAAQEACDNDFKVLRDRRQLSWYHSADPATLTAQTKWGVYEIVEVNPQTYKVAVTRRGKTHPLHGLSANLEAALAICQQNLNEQSAKKSSGLERG